MEAINANNYGKYAGVRDASWDLLIAQRVAALPVGVMKIARRLGITVMSYTEAADLLKYCELTGHSTTNEGFSLYTDRWYILYYPKIEPVETTRYILARELGRILMGLPLVEQKVGYFTAYYSNELLSEQNENDATSFAVRILAPACVLAAIKCIEPYDIAELCGLPEHIAIERSDRLKELLKKDLFLKHQLEQKVFENFKQFIEENK